MKPIEFKEPHILLKEYLDTWGHKYKWLTDKLDYDRSWIYKVFSGDIPLTDELQAQIESIFEKKIFSTEPVDIEMEGSQTL